MTSINNEDLIPWFIQNAVTTTATVERIKGTAELLYNAFNSQISGDECVLLSEPNDINPELVSLFKKDPRVITSPTKEQLTSVRTGVTDAFCGIASTGSVCVSVSGNLSVHVSMLTRKHIVIIEGKTIIPMPRDLFSEKYLNGKGLSRSFSIITGPSATADMGPLVRGVHGPGKLHIIILE